MAKKLHRLTAIEVAAKGPGFHADGGNLYLHVDSAGRRRWTFRYAVGGRQRDAGLGSAAKGGVSLADARTRAAEGRKLLQDGLDPLTEWRKPPPTTPTFGEIADNFIAAHEGSWRSATHRAQWKMTLREYCADMRLKPVGEIGTEDVLGALKPIWTRAPETASRLRGRIEVILDAARVQKFRPENELNPARWRGNLDKLLPSPRKRDRGHHAAMPYEDVPAFVATLRTGRGASSRALLFAILTAARTGEVLGARWEEIDMAGALWTIPKERMKGGVEHRQPLSHAALALLHTIKAEGDAEPDDFVFKGQKRGRALSNMAAEMVMRRAKQPFTPHGFRSAFRDWAGDETNAPREVCEAALAHTVGSATERAYRRGDALEKRRLLLAAWARYLDGDENAGRNWDRIDADGENVVSLAGRRA